MKILNTSSNQCKILIDKDKKYVIRYPRSIGVTREYYRSTPELEIIELLSKNNIDVPKIIKNTSQYLIQEYISGSLLSNLYEDHKDIDKEIINQIIDQICLLTTISGDSLLKYANWTNNSGYYTFQLNNTNLVFEQYYQILGPLYHKLGISKNIMDVLVPYASQLDDNRNISVIHGDRHKKNVILQDNKKVFFIDWELGCIGDIAYDIAFHLHQMAYTKNDENYFMDRLKEKYTGNFETLLNDINLYRLFILTRSMLYHVYWTYLLYKEEDKDAREKQLSHFMKRYNRLSSFKEFNLSFKEKDELDIIFKNYNKDYN